MSIRWPIEMRSLFRKLPGYLSANHATGLVLLLVLVVLLPSLCLLWFMNEAIQNERLAVRQKLVEAYRSHLALAQENLDSFSSKLAQELSSRNSPAREWFAKFVNAGRVDSLICTENGTVLYPDSPVVPRAEPFPDEWTQAGALESLDARAAAGLYGRLAQQETTPELLAKALQAQARCLMQAGDKQAGCQVLTNLLTAQAVEQAVDDQGRLILPNAQLMMLELCATSDSRVLGRLQATLNDYSSALPAAQRRFLMHEVQQLFPESRFPTVQAEDLAHQYLETDVTKSTGPGFRETPLRGVWQLTSADGRVISLHRTEALISRMRSAISPAGLPADMKLELLPPGQEREGMLLSLSAGAQFSGWRLALSSTDPLTAGRKAQASSYLWIGSAGVAAIVLVGALALGLLRRQIALTRLRNDLVANVTHELKTPLSSMRLLVDTLLDSPGMDARATREYLELIARENGRLSRLIDNFLTFSRIERNKYVFAFRTVPAESVARDAAAAVRDRFQAAGCCLEVDFARDLPSVLVDADAMMAALINLLDNAWKYSGENKQIRLCCGRENGSVFYAVQDNGIGFSPGERKRIFKRFYQVPQAAPHAGGCGLGLSIVHSIVQAHGGWIEVESELQRGSTFRIVLPERGAGD